MGPVPGNFTVTVGSRPLPTASLLPWPFNVREPPAHALLGRRMRRSGLRETSLGERVPSRWNCFYSLKLPMGWAGPEVSIVEVLAKKQLFVSLVYLSIIVFTAAYAVDVEGDEAETLGDNELVIMGSTQQLKPLTQ